MAKNAVSDWDTVAANNTDLGGIGIQGTNLPSNFDNALRELMAQVRTFFTTGPVAVGSATALAIDGNTSRLQVLGTTGATGALSLAMFNTSATTAARLDFYKSKNAAVGSATVVASGDILGTINFIGAQQTGTFATQNTAVQIRAEVDGVVTSGAAADMPGRLIFYTTPDGSGSLTERLRIGADGTMTVAASGAFVLPQSAAPAPTVEGDMRWDTDDNVLRIGNGTTATQIGIAMGTLTATTSGSSKQFTIPAGAKRIMMSLNAVSTNGTNNLIVRIGDAGGIETTTYVANVSAITTAVSTTNTTGAFLAANPAAASQMSGICILTLMDAASFLWAYSSNVLRSDAAGMWVGAGVKALSAELTTVELATTDTFDNGSVNVMWE